MTPRLKPRLGVECIIYAGDDFELTLVAIDEDDVPMPIAGASVEFGVYAVSGGSWVGPALISKATGNGIDLLPAPGEMLVSLPAAETKGLPNGNHYIVARITTALGAAGTLQPFLATVQRTPLTPA